MSHSRCALPALPALFVLFALPVLAGLACGPKVAKDAKDARPAVGREPVALDAAASAATPATPATPDPTVAASPTARCGRLPGEPIVKVASPWGPHPRCDEAATRWANLAHADKVCARDADCALVGFPAITCNEDAVTVAASRRPEFKEAPCANPAAGPCAAPSRRAVCRDGCCAAEP